MTELVAARGERLLHAELVQKKKDTYRKPKEKGNEVEKMRMLKMGGGGAFRI